MKVEGQGKTTKFLDLPDNSIAEDEGNLDDRDYPYSRPGLSDGSDLRIATVVTTVLMVQEKREAEAGEFRPEPECEEVEDVCGVPLDQKKKTPPVAEQR